MALKNPSSNSPLKAELKTEPSGHRIKPQSLNKPT